MSWNRNLTISWLPSRRQTRRSSFFLDFKLLTILWSSDLGMFFFQKWFVLFNTVLIFYATHQQLIKLISQELKSRDTECLHRSIGPVPRVTTGGTVPDELRRQSIKRHTPLVGPAVEPLDRANGVRRSIYRCVVEWMWCTGIVDLVPPSSDWWFHNRLSFICHRFAAVCRKNMDP